MQRLVAALCALFTTVVLADDTPCTRTAGAPPLIAPVTLAPMGSATNTLTFDQFALDMLHSPGVTQIASCSDGKSCLLVPWYTSSSSCGILKTDCAPAEGEFCMVTDEFSQLGLILAMSSSPDAVTAFGQWVTTLRLISTPATAGLPAWLVRVRVADGVATINNSTDDDAADGTARAILALYIAANSGNHEANRAAYEKLADDLATRFVRFDFRDIANAYPVERFWLAAGKNSAANPITNIQPFSYAGYFGDVLLALLAAHRSTGDTRYLRVASDTIDNYARAANFSGGFVVPPMRFAWTVTDSATPPVVVCRDSCQLADRTQCNASDRFCDLARWDNDDAPRAVSLCKASYYIRQMSAPVASAALLRLENYCDAWMQSAGVQNGGPDYSRSYFWSGSPYLAPSSDYYQAGLGASLNFFGCKDDLRTRLQAAASMYDAPYHRFKDESCLGVYTHAFFGVNFGSALGRDYAALVSTVAAPQNVTVQPTAGSYLVSWSAVANATGYEVARSCNGDTFLQPAFVATTSWTDDMAPANGTKYFYRVRTVQQSSSSTQRSPYSPAVATGVPFEPEIEPRETVVRAADMAAIQNAVNGLRAAAGLSAKSYPPLQEQPIKASDFQTLQVDINDARQQLGVPAWRFDDVRPGNTISARDLQELRDATCACADQTLYNPAEH